MLTDVTNKHHVYMLFFAAIILDGWRLLLDRFCLFVGIFIEIVSFLFTHRHTQNEIEKKMI